MLSRKHKVYLKLNIVSILFAVVSLMSVTLAWFAYSGLVDIETEVGVKAWYIEFEKNDEAITNDIVISLADIYPGMDTVKETIKVKNLGDTDAKLKYKISEARILDDAADYYEMDDDIKSEYIEDALANKYPFHINISVSKKYIAAKDEDTVFEVSVSWPLDSGDDALDSMWGNKAYQYDMRQKRLKNENSEYVVKPAIKILINVTAEQAIDDLNSIDSSFTLGKEILYDVVSNKSCNIISDTCLKTHVIDDNNLISDNFVSLLLDSDVGTGTYQDYINLDKNWNVNIRRLKVTEILKAVSIDLDNSIVKVDGISDRILGNLSYGRRAEYELERVKSLSGYFIYSKDFTYLSSDDCVWTEDLYNNNAFAYINTSDSVKLYGIDKTTMCKLKPVIVVAKENIEVVS